MRRLAHLVRALRRRRLRRKYRRLGLDPEVGEQLVRLADDLAADPRRYSRMALYPSERTDEPR